MMGEMGAFFGIQAISPTKTVEALGGLFRSESETSEWDLVPAPIFDRLWDR